MAVLCSSDDALMSAIICATREIDRCVERRNVRLERDAVDYADDPGDRSELRAMPRIFATKSSTAPLRRELASSAFVASVFASRAWSALRRMVTVRACTLAAVFPERRGLVSVRAPLSSLSFGAKVNCANERNGPQPRAGLAHAGRYRQARCRRACVAAENHCMRVYGNTAFA